MVPNLVPTQWSCTVLVHPVLPEVLCPVWEQTSALGAYGKLPWVHTSPPNPGPRLVRLGSRVCMFPEGLTGWLPSPSLCGSVGKAGVCPQGWPGRCQSPGLCESVGRAGVCRQGWPGPRPFPECCAVPAPAGSGPALHGASVNGLFAGPRPPAPHGALARRAAGTRRPPAPQDIVVFDEN